MVRAREKNRTESLPSTILGPFLIFFPSFQRPITGVRPPHAIQSSQGGPTECPTFSRLKRQICRNKRRAQLTESKSVTPGFLCIVSSSVASIVLATCACSKQAFPGPSPASPSFAARGGRRKEKQSTDGRPHRGSGATVICMSSPPAPSSSLLPC